MGAIYIDDDGKAVVNQEECVECQNCYRSLRDEGYHPLLVGFVRRILSAFRLTYDADVDVCPTGALTPPELEWPRVLRSHFSDPAAIHPATGVGGRGTEEIKTNDVTGRIGDGEAGLVVELGRPGTGAHLRDVERVSMRLAPLGVHFEERNPITALMVDPYSGKLKPEVLEEKVLSAIIECKVDLERLPLALDAINEATRELDTVLSLGTACRCGPAGQLSYEVLDGGGRLKPLLQWQDQSGSGEDAMTNTLHRRGTEESLGGDYVVFAMAAKGFNEEGSEEKLNVFRRLALRHGPVIMPGVTPKEMEELSPAEIAERTDTQGRLRGLATFDNLQAVCAFLDDLKEVDLGLSINVSGLLGQVETCCQRSGITRHSVEQSLGIKGQMGRLPEESILEISTMCGHGMVSFNLIRRMVDLIKRGKFTSRQAARILAKPCICGCFNLSRAEQLLERMRLAG